MTQLSIVIPIYNEADSLEKLFAEILNVLGENNFNYEIIAVSDGSTDKSNQILKEISARNEKIKTIIFSRNFGQTAAMAAGFKFASGDIIIPLDADMQNDPRDIPRLIDKLSAGYDIVSGWRKNRHDKLLSRKIPSWIANSLISKITGVNLHDYGCTIKAYRATLLKKINLYGEMHRFIPALAAWQGARITELVVNHRERQFGRAKYGIKRTFKVILDLLTVKFLVEYSTRPMHFFGRAAFYSWFFAIISGLFAVILRFTLAISFIETPLPLLTVFLMLVGLQFILMGLLAEMQSRIYYESQDKSTYVIKEKINF